MLILIFLVLKTCLKSLFQNWAIFGVLNLFRGNIQNRDILMSALLPKLWKLQKPNGYTEETKQLAMLFLKPNQSKTRTNPKVLWIYNLSSKTILVSRHCEHWPIEMKIQSPTSKRPAFPSASLVPVKCQKLPQLGSLNELTQLKLSITSSCGKWMCA